jgi:hypothetical protein
LEESVWGNLEVECFGEEDEVRCRFSEIRIKQSKSVLGLKEGFYIE